MLHIILTILKIIGIILAALLGFLLVVLLLVLFVPIGYSAEADNKKDLLVKANAWWLFHALHISFLMDGIPSEKEGRSPVIKVRILGIPIIDTSRKKEEKEKKENTASEKPEEIIRKPELTTQEVLKKPELEKPALTEEKKAEETKPEETKEVQAVEEKKTVSEKRISEQITTKKVKKEKAGKQLSEPKKVKEKEHPKNSEKKKLKLSDISEKIKGFKENLKNKISSIRQTIQNLLGKAELIKAFFKNEENREGISKIFVSLKGILKHLLPKKIKGQVLFGMADPCTTGQALGVLGILYPYYGKSIFIKPDFSRQVLEGNLYLKGYIQIFTLCVIGIKLLINTNFRKLIKNVMKLKEEL